MNLNAHIEAGGMMIASIPTDKRYKMYAKEGKANARLIAAAPELAEACEQALQLNGNPRRDTQDAAEWNEIMSKIQSALAKAKGE
jgi:hypothetical protein